MPTILVYSNSFFLFINSFRAFIKITVHGINPVQLSLASPQLTLLKNPENLVLTKVTKNENLVSAPTMIGTVCRI